MGWNRRIFWMFLALVLFICAATYHLYPRLYVSVQYKPPQEGLLAKAAGSVAARNPLRPFRVHARNPNRRVRIFPAKSRTLLADKPATSAASGANKTRRPVRIFCMILTSPVNLDTKAIFVEQSWAYKCDGHKFITVIPEAYTQFNPKLVERLKNNESIEFNTTMLPLFQPAGFRSDNYTKLTDKVYRMFMDMHRHFNDYDWYLKADDDTMIFVDNLREFLSTKNASDKLTYGYHFKTLLPKGYHSGGGGYVIPRQALMDIGQKLTANYGSCVNTGTEDFDVAHSLATLGYVPGSSLDEKGRERFHTLSVLYHYYGYFPDWLLLYSANGVKKGMECCSDSSISYHYMTPEEIVLLGEMLKNTTRKPTFKDVLDQLRIAEIN